MENEQALWDQFGTSERVRLEVFTTRAPLCSDAFSVLYKWDILSPIGPRLEWDSVVGKLIRNPETIMDTVAL